MEVGFGYDPHFTAAIVNWRKHAITRFERQSWILSVIEMFRQLTSVMLVFICDDARTEDISRSPLSRRSRQTARIEAS
jgi:hypothetical protein